MIWRRFPREPGIPSDEPAPASRRGRSARHPGRPRVAVVAPTGERLTPCAQEKARALVALGLATWLDPDARIQLRYDFWRGRTMTRHILRRDGGRCVYCGAIATSADHLFPWSLGGLTVPANLVAACSDGRNGRGTLALEAGVVDHPQASAHPTLATCLADSGTAGHQIRMEAILAHGVPDPTAGTSARDVKRWLRLYRDRNPEHWEHLIHTAPSPAHPDGAETSARGPR